MREKIKSLVNQYVEFFDDHSGTLLDVRGNSREDWWEQGKFLITKAEGKFFVVCDTKTGEIAGHRYKTISRVEGTEIHFL